jgi:hypothetical protein
MQPRHRKVRLADLKVDGTYQRELDETRVQRIVDEFNPALLGALEVSQRNGKFAVFDGQHRLAALKALGKDTAPCIVHEGLSVAEEAALFVQLQTQRKALSPYDRFRARLRAGEPAAIEIQQIAKDRGYTIVRGGHDRQIGAVASLDRVYARGGGDLLDKALSWIATYQGEPKGTDGALIEGFAIAIQKYGDDPRFFERLPVVVENTPAATILRKAIAALETGGGSASRPQAVAKELAKLCGIRGPYKKRAKAAA